MPIKTQYVKAEASNSANTSHPNLPVHHCELSQQEFALITAVDDIAVHTFLLVFRCTVMWKLCPVCVKPSPSQPVTVFSVNNLVVNWVPAHVVNQYGS